MSTKKHPYGYVNIEPEMACPYNMPEHGIQNGNNKVFYNALIELLDLLRAEALIRECHPIHEKILELKNFIKQETCQDYTSLYYPEQIYQSE